MQERIIKISRLRPGEPHEEIHNLSITVSPDVEGFFLRLHDTLDEPSMAEYWFETLETVDRQARILFGERFAGWEDPAG